MTQRTPKLRWLLAVLATFALIAAACGGDSDDEGSSSNGGDTSNGAGEGGNGGGDEPGEGEVAEVTFEAADIDISTIDLSGIEITVGSKDFTENQLIAEIFAQAVEAAGGSVNREIDLGGTNENRAALESSRIDVYPEYNGTGWTIHLGNEDPSNDPDELYRVTSEADLEQNGIRWLGRSAFNNTYGFATGPELTDAHGGAFTLQDMADYLEENPDAQACMEVEFPDRPDGLVLFEEATGYVVPDSQQEIMESAIIFTETARGDCAFGEIFTTDGRIPALNLTVVDDGGAFIIYNISLTIDDDIYQQAPEAFDALAEALINNLENEGVTYMIYRIDVVGETREQVASDYLTQLGIL